MTNAEKRAQQLAYQRLWREAYRKRRIQMEMPWHCRVRFYVADLIDPVFVAVAFGVIALLAVVLAIIVLL